MNENKPVVLEQLQQVTQGLTFVSEADYALEPYFIAGTKPKAINPKTILQANKYPDGIRVESMTLQDFFRAALKEETWHHEEEKALVKRYQTLVQTLKDNLSEIKVFKVGETEIDVFVVGKTKSGEIAGVKTKVVET